MNKRLFNILIIALLIFNSLTGAVYALGSTHGSENTSESTAQIHLTPETGYALVDSNVAVDIRLFTMYADVDAIDLVLSYSGSANFNILDGSDTTAGLNIVPGSAFARIIVNRVDEANNKIYLTAYTAQPPLNTSNGYALIGRILFKATTIGAVNFSIDFTKGLTNESNVAEHETSVDILDAIHNSTINIVEVLPTDVPVTTTIPFTILTPTATLTVTPTDSITPSLTGTVTNSPTSGPTTTPTIAPTGLPDSGEEDYKPPLYFDETVNRPVLTTVKAFLRQYPILSETIIPILPLTGMATQTAVVVLMYPNSLLYAFFWIKRRKKANAWGLIFDGSTKKPIAFAVIRILQDGKLLDSTVSDINGKYGMVMDAGTYTLEVQHSDYITYTTTIKLHHQDNPVTELIALKNKPTNKVQKVILRFEALWPKISLAILVIGFIFSIFAMILNPNPINSAIFIAYIAQAVMLAFPSLNRNFATLIDANNKPLTGALIKIYGRTQFSDITQLEVLITDEKGRFYCRQKPNTEYYIEIHTPGFEISDAMDLRTFPDGKITAIVFTNSMGIINTKIKAKESLNEDLAGFSSEKFGVII